MGSEVQHHGLYIGGGWTGGTGGRTFTSLDPATGKPLAEVTEASSEDVDRAVAAARGALEDEAWAHMDPSQRGRLLFRLGQLIREDLEGMARLETLDVGKPLKEAKGDVTYAAWTFEYFAGMADKLQGETIPVPGDRFDYTLVEPLGVTAHIVPWNYPIVLASRGIAPALAAGNAVVVKPSSLAPLTNLRLAELAGKAGLPKGVYNVITGSGPSVGSTLAAHPDVDGITFTGSAATGKEIMRRAADHVTPVILELGGKCPNIVFPDVEQDRALRGVLRGIFTNAGQMCWAGSRLLVQEEIHRDFVGKLAEQAGRMRVGSGLDDKTDMGPLVSDGQVHRVLEYIDIGKEEGAKLVAGGGRAKGEAAGGFYLQPTVFDDVTPDMRIAREEIFGPVLSVLAFGDLDEAVRIANGTEYGLCAGLWTRRLDIAHHAAARLQAGMVAVNEYPITFPQAPFGGYKESGIGHEQGMGAVYHYTRTKNVVMNLR